MFNQYYVLNNIVNLLLLLLKYRTNNYKNENYEDDIIGKIIIELAIVPEYSTTIIRELVHSLHNHKILFLLNKINKNNDITKGLSSEEDKINAWWEWYVINFIK